MRKPGLFLAAAVLAMPAAAAPDGDLIALSLRSRMYRLSAGRLTPLPVEAMATDLQQPHGPKISPDRRWIAFSNSGDLWIYHVASGRRYQATHFGREETAKLLGVEVLTPGWSADSSRVLIRVISMPELCDDCPQVRRPAPVAYGYYTYDPAANKIARVRLPEKFEFRAWLPDDRFLGVIDRDSACLHGAIAECGTLVIMRDGSPARQIQGFNGLHAQLSIRPDGKFAGTSDPDQGDDRENQSQIVRIELSSGKGQWLTPVGVRGEYQDPQFSPDGSHIAWLWFRRPLGSGRFVVLDGNRIFSCSRESFDLQWLDAGRIAVECGQELTVIDPSGKVLARMPIPKFSAAGR